MQGEVEESIQEQRNAEDKAKKAILDVSSCHDHISHLYELQLT